MLVACVLLQAAFIQLERYFMENKHSLHDRAPKHWMVPRLLDCTLCHQNDCVKPVIAEKKREINWLFLLLTQTLGLCTLDQLKFFCKHNDKHRTGAKDRVLYSTYGGLLKQLNPAGKYLPNDWFTYLMLQSACSPGCPIICREREAALATMCSTKFQIPSSKFLLVHLQPQVIRKEGVASIFGVDSVLLDFSSSHSSFLTAGQNLSWCSPLTTFIPFSFQSDKGRMGTSTACALSGF